MSERILMPLDGSEIGEAALSYVEGLISRLAPGEAVEITLLHVITTVRHNVPYKGGGMVSIPYTEEQLKTFKDEARAYLDRVSKNLQNSKTTVVCRVSVSENPAEAIIETEKETNADLVAMATHGRGGLSRFAFGSVADRVMRGGSVPVLMVRSSEN